MKKKILFLCTGNSCRSQMAEALAKKMLSKKLHIESAGTEAHGLNPYTVKTMNEIGIDISNNKSKRIKTEDLNKFNLIITLCGDARDKCLVIDSELDHIHWDIPDPANCKGTEEEIREKYSKTRELIFNYIKTLK